MNAWSLTILSLTSVVLAVDGVTFESSLGRLTPSTQRQDKEVYVRTELDGNLNTHEFVIVEKESAVAYACLSSEYENYTDLTLSDGFGSGTPPIADATAIRDLNSGTRLVTASSSYNVLTLTSSLDLANLNQTDTSHHQSFHPLPSIVSPILAPGGGINLDREDVLVISSSLESGVGILNNAITPPNSNQLISNAAQTTQGIEGLQPIQLDGSTNKVVGLKRSSIGSVDVVILEALGAENKSNFSLVTTTSANLGVSDFIFYPSKLPDLEYNVFTYESGFDHLEIYRLNASSAYLAETYTARSKIDFICTLESPDGYKIFLAYTNGQADVLKYAEGGFKNLFSLSSPKIGSWLGVLCAKDGSFYALQGSAGLATDFTQIGYRDGEYYIQSTGSLNRGSPDRNPYNNIQAVAYTEAPFKGRSLPIQTYKVGDWSTASGSNGQITSLRYLNSTDGLKEEVSGNITPPTSNLSLAINQYSEKISFWFGSGPTGNQGPITTISPRSVSELTKAIKPQIEAQPIGEIFYRFGQTGDFTKTDGSSLPAITSDTTIQAYAESSGVKGPLTQVTYSFKNSANSRDSDGDGLPDALESDIESDPLNVDSDRDGSNDLADLLGGGIDAVTDGSIVASNAEKELASGGQANIRILAYGQAEYPNRQAALALSKNDPVEYPSIIDAFAFLDNSGHRTNAPLRATSGLVTVENSIGTELESAVIVGEAVEVNSIPTSNHKQFLLAQIGSAHLAPDHRPWYNDFESSSDGWQTIDSEILRPAPRKQRPENNALYALYVDENNSDSRQIIYNDSSAPTIWLGNYLEAQADKLSEDQRSASRIRAILCEVLSLDKARDGYLHIALSSDNEIYISDGFYLPKMDPKMLSNATSEAIWAPLLIPIGSENFTRVFTNNPLLDFDNLLMQITQIGFVVSDNGDPLSLIQNDRYAGSILHKGFSIDNIRAVGMPAGGYRMVAITATPDKTLQVPAYIGDPTASVASSVNEWAEDFKATRSSTDTEVEISVASTTVAILFEKTVNRALNQQDAILYPQSKRFAFFNDLLTSSTAFETFTIEDLSYLRYPTQTTKNPTLTLAWETQDILDSIQQELELNEQNKGHLHSVSHAIYRVATTFTGLAPEIYDQPISALYGLLNTNSLPDIWRDSLASAGIDSAAISSAFQEAESIVISALFASRRIVESSIQLTRQLGGSWIDALGSNWDLRDRDGDPFQMPNQFALPDGSTMEVTGFILPQVGSTKRMEVTNSSIISLPRNTPQDKDGNLLDDRWEIQFFGHTGVEPFGDSDGDGYNNISEFLNGSDPKIISSTGSRAMPTPPRLNWPFSIKIEQDPNNRIALRLPMPKAQSDEFEWIIEVTNDLESYSIQNSVQTVDEQEVKTFIFDKGDYQKAFYRLKPGLR